MSKNVLPWYLGGVFLAIAFLAAVIFVKPIGVSTQFVIADGLVWQLFDSSLITENSEAAKGYQSSNAYLNKSGGKYAANIANPLNYSFVFVLAMIAGAFVSALFKGDKPETDQQKQMPDLWREKFGDCYMKRYGWSFLAGFIVLFGARLAGGCTSGHMMSGMMQTSLSGFLFAAGAFAAAIPLAILLYRR